MKILAEELNDLVLACFSGIWIQSDEHFDAIEEIGALCRNNQWELATWDATNGLGYDQADPSADQVADPVSALKSIAESNSSMPTLLVLKNFHRFLNSAEVVQAFAEQVQRGKQSRNYYIVLSPKIDIPVELKTAFALVDHRRPTKTQLAEIVRSIATEESDLPDDEEFEGILDASSGLTRCEAENAVSLSLVRDGQVRAKTIQEFKCQSLKTSGLMTIHESHSGFEQIGGLESVKEFCQQALGSKSKCARPRGILLLGVPGTGKSAFAKALGHEIGRPTLSLDVGRLMGSLVGQTENNIRQALEIADAMSPCLLFVDELEKAFAGMSSSGRNDSGVTARMGGTFLNWLNDHESNVFLVATSNDITKLPPEMTRSERFDAIFFVDLPSQNDRLSIWHIWMNVFDIDPVATIPTDDLWTGSEIRSCCRLAALLGQSLEQAAKYIVPIAVTSKESVDSLRKWANARCLSAGEPGVFRCTSKKASRRALGTVGPKPSDN